MVYLITSNTQSTGLNVPDTTGINNPSSFVNMLSQTFEIEKDSEVAVESIKITRNGNLQLSSANNKFGIYIGENPVGVGGNQEGLAFRTGFCVPTKITGGTITKSPTDMAYNIREGLLQGLGQHPNFVPIDTDYPKVELKNGSNEFQGFKYTFTQNKESEKTHIPATAGDGWVASDGLNLNAIVSASGSHEVKLLKKDPEELVGHLSVIGQKFPLNLANGSVVFCFNSSLNGSAGDLWEVGLTRATFNNHQVEDGLAGPPEHFKDTYTGFNYFDYSVRPNFVNGSFEIFCSGATLQESEGEKSEFFKHKVKGLPNVSLTEHKGTDKAFNRVKIIAKNEGLIFQLLSFNGSITTLLDTTSGITDRDKTVKPIGISNFYLYPKVNILDTPSASRCMVIDGYDGLDIPTYRFSKHNSNASFQYGGRFRGEALEPAILGFKCDGELTYQDYYATALWTGKSGILETYETRYPFNFFFDSLNAYTPKGLNGCATTHSQVLDRDIILVSAGDEGMNGALALGSRDTGEDDLTTITAVQFQSRFHTFWTNRYGAQNMLGFENVPVQSIKFTNGTIPQSKESKTAPKMISNKSLFVRLPDLPIESFNSGKGSVSKILYHMPRFDNTGNEVGGLYYQPNERLYIPLGNTDKIRLNNIKVELCNIDETNDKTDLIGQTIVCFDFRPRRRQ